MLLFFTFLLRKCVMQTQLMKNLYHLCVTERTVGALFANANPCRNRYATTQTVVIKKKKRSTRESTSPDVPLRGWTVFRLKKTYPSLEMDPRAAPGSEPGSAWV